MSKKCLFILAAVLLSAAISCKKTEKKTDPVKKEITEVIEVTTLKFALEPKSESTAAGEVTFSEENGKVTMTATLTGLTEGEHAIHIHEKADCSSPDGKSTGGHWNPTFVPHGKWGAAEGYHKGDIGNFTADANGNGSITMTTDEWCIGCGDETKDILGRAIIVHQGVDDYVTQPTGAAGGRVSCGGIIQ
ncbi:superoxide dismutase family protein [Leptobacterium sp. I13]|uniref:superoxide dismutase family protein n=1 Tax=Leptobacterium meishanense TaxID=3128904 RepID=UPI0030EE02F0